LFVHHGFILKTAACSSRKKKADSFTVEHNLLETDNRLHEDIPYKIYLIELKPQKVEARPSPGNGSE
jgi:hypothetical protein